MGTPKHVQRCEHCFINILDDINHLCVQHQIVAFRQWIYVKQLHTMFTFKIDGEIFHRNSRNGCFELVSDGQKVLSTATDGLISFKKEGDSIVASYSASSFKRFSIVFARLIQNQWKCFLALETSPSGLRAHNVNLNVTNMLLDELKLNTISILGLKPKSIYMDIDVFANSSGEIDETNFNGYKASYLIANRLEIEVILVIFLYKN